jgi:transposase
MRFSASGPKLVRSSSGHESPPVDEWACVEPLIPPAKRGGGKRRTDMRAVMNGVMYILSTGCQWRYLPKDFPPRSTLHDYFTWWICDGTPNRSAITHSAPRASRRTSKTAARWRRPRRWRAAFKAGVKPSQIARQFGISQAAVRNALAGDGSKAND